MRTSYYILIKHITYSYYIQVITYYILNIDLFRSNLDAGLERAGAAFAVYYKVR